MRVLLISGNREDVDMRVPALGLTCAGAAAENAGNETMLLDFLTEKDPRDAVMRAVKGFQPEAIGISVRNIDNQKMIGVRFLLDQALDAVKYCRDASSAPIILGGAGFSILPQPILDYLKDDIGVQGEGEIVFPELLKRLKNHESIDELPGVFQRGKPAPIRRSYSKDLDSYILPAPSAFAKTLYGAKDAPVPIQTRRGCPLSCIYCSTPLIEGRQLRWRTPESVISWMIPWIKQGFNKFYFVDNTFNLPPSYAINLCSKIIAANLKISWHCILFPGGLDAKLIELLARAGCTEASLGFESGSPAILSRMKKQFSLDEVRKASGLLKQYGIRRMGFLLLGGPGETKVTVEESISFAESLQLDSIKLSAGIRIYPKTDVAAQAMHEGIITLESDLLFPHFYIAKGLEEWLPEKIAEQASRHPEWTY
jgi:radical SAM superfamily enzyme YgiQ (UPF0313 family)